MNISTPGYEATNGPPRREALRVHRDVSLLFLLPVDHLGRSALEDYGNPAAFRASRSEK